MIFIHKMKDTLKQVEFLDTLLLPAYGISSIHDTTTRVSSDTITDEQLQKIDECVGELRACYPVKSFSLHKTNYRIVKKEQAISVLKRCLVLSNVPFMVNSSNAVRLTEENKSLLYYKQKTSEFRTNLKSQMNDTIKAGTGLTRSGDVFSVNSELPHVKALGQLSGLNSSGPVVISCTAPFVSPNAGALRVAGDVNFETRLHVGGDIYIRGKKVITESDLESLLSRITKLEDSLDTDE